MGLASPGDGEGWEREDSLSVKETQQSLRHSMGPSGKKVQAAFGGCEGSRITPQQDSGTLAPTSHSPTGRR